MSAERRVLVTGAGGFIGRQSIAPLLAANYEVHAVLSMRGAQNGEDALLDRAEVHRADLTDERAIDALIGEVRPTHLLHFAWIATPGSYWESADNYRWLSASEHLLHAFKANGGVRAVMAGTCAEYDWSRGGICDERTSPLASGEPTAYAKTKMAMQRALDEFGRQHDLSTAWGRIFFQYGPREHPDRLVASVIIHLLLGRNALCTHGRQIRSFLHVEDVGAAFAALLDSTVEGAVNIGSAERVSIAQVLSMIARHIGRPDLLQLGARSASPSEPAVLVPQLNRLRDEVRFVPRFTLEAGIADSIRWWRATLSETALAASSR